MVSFASWLGVEHTPDNERLVLLAFLSLSPLERGGFCFNSNLMLMYPGAGDASWFLLLLGFAWDTPLTMKDSCYSLS